MEIEEEYKEIFDKYVEDINENNKLYYVTIDNKIPFLGYQYKLGYKDKHTALKRFADKIRYDLVHRAYNNNLSEDKIASKFIHYLIDSGRLRVIAFDDYVNNSNNQSL